VSRKRAITNLASLTLAAILLYLSFRGVDWAELRAQMHRWNWWYLAAYVLLAPIHTWLRAWRWRSLLDPIRPGLPMKDVFAAVALSNMMMILPGRVGELVRPAVINRRTGVPFLPALATVGVERLTLDLLAILVFGAFGLLLPPAWSGLVEEFDPAVLEAVSTTGLVCLLVGLVGLVAVFLFGRARVPLNAFLARRAPAARPRFLGRLMTWFADLLPGLAAMTTVRGTTILVLQTAALWLTIALSMWSGILAAGVDLTPGAMLLLMPILTLGFSLPAPGGTGTVHYAMKIALTGLFGVPAAAAVGAGLAVHTFNWVPIIAMGGYILLRQGIPPVVRDRATISRPGSPEEPLSREGAPR